VPRSSSCHRLPLHGNDNYRVAIWDLPLQARADNGVFVVAANGRDGMAGVTSG
jgi:hypothetical protein